MTATGRQVTDPDRGEGLAPANLGQPTARRDRIIACLQTSNRRMTLGHDEGGRQTPYASATKYRWIGFDIPVTRLRIELIDARCR